MSNCKQIPADELGCLEFTLQQFNTKAFTLSFDTDISGSSQPLDLTQYDRIRITFRQDSTSIGKFYKELTLADGLSIIGANNEILSMDFGVDFYEKKMPRLLRFDIIMEKDSPSEVVHYLYGKVNVILKNTQV